jgi:ABC-type lipoprotein export system ATPase subunit
MLNSPIIEVRQVKQSFATPEGPVEVIKEANFTIEQNTFNIVYGPSGSGKSTLLNTISGLQKPTAGSIFIMGHDLYSLNPDELAFFRANRVGIVQQTNSWVNSLSVLGNVSLPLYFQGYSRKDAEKLGLSTLERLGMEKYADKNPMLLSGGEQQRIAMARALANTPQFIIADEPTGNLDIENGDKMIELLQTCKDVFRCTIILVTHNIEYLPIADNIFHIREGIITQGDSGNIKETTKQLLGSIDARLAKIKGMKTQ